jgi:hypothetical protein
MILIAVIPTCCVSPATSKVLPLELLAAADGAELVVGLRDVAGHPPLRVLARSQVSIPTLSMSVTTPRRARVVVACSSPWLNVVSEQRMR